MTDKDIAFWEGFDAAIEMVLNHLDNSELLENLPGTQILLRHEIIDNVELYKKDG